MYVPLYLFLDDNKNEDNYFKHTTEQLENIAIINGKLKVLFIS